MLQVEEKQRKKKEEEDRIREIEEKQVRVVCTCIKFGLLYPEPYGICIR